MTEDDDSIDCPEDLEFMAALQWPELLYYLSEPGEETPCNDLPWDADGYDL